MKVLRQRRDWDDMSDLDPLWAILSHEDKRAGGWAEDEFMALGRTEIARLMERAAALGHPRARRAALDFGCGAGRLTRALAEHFERSVGVDISERMVAHARRLNAGVPGCEFVASSAPDLRRFGDDAFDLVYSRLVLQHVPSPPAIVAYVGELARVLAPGGLLAFQVPTHIPLRHRLQPRPRLYGALRRTGVSRETLYRRLKLHPIRMSFVPAARIEAALAGAGGRVLDRDVHRVTGGVTSSTYYVTK
jgi:SAM-dependent methyltransferase